MRIRRRRNLFLLFATGLLVALAAGPLAGGASSQTAGSTPTTETGQKPKNPLAGDGMWIWYLSHSAHGRVGKIASRAHARGIETVLVKSGDGTHYWGQFSSSMVSQLHSRG